MKKYSIVIFLLITVILMSFIKITYDPSKDEIATLKPTPTVQATPTINQYPLQDKLPYQGKNFTITKYVEAGVIEVQTKRTDKSKIKTEIKKWFDDNKTSAEGIQIDWK